MALFKRKQELPRILVLVDYENVAREAAAEGKIVDFEKLATLCRDLGTVVASFIFIPQHFYDSWVAAAHDQGFFVVVSPSRKDLATATKQKDSVDTLMITLGVKLLDAIDRIVIVVNDADLSTLANQARDKRKKMVLISGEKVSPVLRKVVDFSYPIPLLQRTR